MATMPINWALERIETGRNICSSGFFSCRWTEKKVSSRQIAPPLTSLWCEGRLLCETVQSLWLKPCRRTGLERHIRRKPRTIVLREQGAAAKIVPSAQRTGFGAPIDDELHLFVTEIRVVHQLFERRAIEIEATWHKARCDPHPVGHIIRQSVDFSQLAGIDVEECGIIKLHFVAALFKCNAENLLLLYRSRHIVRVNLNDIVCDW